MENYDDRAYMGLVTPAQAAGIRRKVRENMKTFLGHRELPLNENTVRAMDKAWVDKVLADPEHYGPSLVEMAEFRRKYRNTHGEARHINTPAYKLVGLIDYPVSS